MFDATAYGICPVFIGTFMLESVCPRPILVECPSPTPFHMCGGDASLLGFFGGSGAYEKANNSGCT